MSNTNINILHRIMEARREKHAMAKVKMDKKITIHKIRINSDIERHNTNGLEYTVGQLSLFVNIPDCIIKSDIEELMNMSEERGKLKGAIIKIEHIIATIRAKKLATTDHVRDRPETSHQYNAIMEWQATYDKALLSNSYNKAGMNTVVFKDRVAGRGCGSAHFFRRGAIAGPYISPTFEDSHQTDFSGATEYNILTNHLEDLDHLNNLDYLLVKSDSTTEEIPHDDNDNSAMSNSTMREIPMDTYNNSTVPNQITAMKVRHTTNHAGKYPATKDLATAQDLAFSNENRDALLAHYRNSPPPRISPSDENRDALLAFYRNYDNSKGATRNTFSE